MSHALCTLALACVWTVSTARAELTWTQKSAEINADAKAAVVEARFHFTNDGAAPVDIRQVQTSCGCTTATLAQRHYDPGQGGEIVARFTVGERVGLQKKTILVSTSDGPVPTLLTLNVHIPELLRLQPAMVIWQQGEPSETKTIEVEAGQNASSVQNLSVLSSNRAMVAELPPATEGGKRQIRVTPTRTDQPLFATLTIRCQDGAETKTFHAFASVQAVRPFAPAKTSPAKTPAASPPVLDDPLMPPG